MDYSKETCAHNDEKNQISQSRRQFLKKAVYTPPSMLVLGVLSSADAGAQSLPPPPPPPGAPIANPGASDAYKYRPY